MTSQSRFSACLLMVVFLTGCDETRVWPNAGRFESSLHCGVSEADVARTAAALGAPVPHRYVGSDGVEQRVFLKNGTAFSLFFEQGRLVTYQRRQYKGMTNLEEYPRINICTGARIARVRLIVVTSNVVYAGATVMIDGKEAALLSRAPSIRADIDVWSGRHELNVVQAGQPRITRVLIIEPSSDQHTVSFP